VLRLLTAGESHGRQITTILDGLPSGLRIDREALAQGMARRRVGYGRGPRQGLETDEVQVLSGVRFGHTTGAPVTLVVTNNEAGEWAQTLSAFGDPEAGIPQRISRPRPGHADLAGMFKYDHHDARDVLERASARESVGRVAAGEILRALLAALSVRVYSHVIQIGQAKADLQAVPPEEIAGRAEANDLRCAAGYEEMRREIESAMADGDTVGGVFEVVAEGLPPGLGSSMAPDRRLDAALGFALLSIPAVKGVEIGPALENAGRRGSRVHDEILPRPSGLPRRTGNRAGGLEGGMTNGEALVVRGAMKPLSTLRRPLRSIDLETNLPMEAAFERSDVCAVPAAGVIAEAVVMQVLTDAFLRAFSSDTMKRLEDSVGAYREELNERMRRAGEGGRK